MHSKKPLGILKKTGMKKKFENYFVCVVVSHKVCKAESYSEILEPFRAQ
jgi:hypothetical protein